MFNERLKEIRKLSGMTQKEVAAAINYAERAYQALEAGRCKPSFDTLIALADCFNVSLNYLVGRTEEQTIGYERVSCDNCNESVIFHFKDSNQNDYALGLSTILGCITFAIQCGDLPKGVATGTKESAFIFTPFPASNGTFKKAYIFESAIDMMSFYSYCKKEKIQETAFISLAGLKPTVPKKLQEQGVQIFSCVDNDDAGRRFEKDNGFTRPDFVKALLDDKGFKDWNEMLVFQTEHPNSTFDKNLHQSAEQNLSNTDTMTRSR